MLGEVPVVVEEKLGMLEEGQGDVDQVRSVDQDTGEHVARCLSGGRITRGS